MLEPIGYSDMYRATDVPTQNADFGIVFIHIERYNIMCSHAIIAITKLATYSVWIEKVEPQATVLIEAP